MVIRRADLENIFLVLYDSHTVPSCVCFPQSDVIIGGDRFIVVARDDGIVIANSKDYGEKVSRSQNRQKICIAHRVKRNALLSRLDHSGHHCLTPAQPLNLCLIKAPFLPNRRSIEWRMVGTFLKSSLPALLNRF